MIGCSCLMSHTQPSENEGLELNYIILQRFADLCRDGVIVQVNIVFFPGKTLSLLYFACLLFVLKLKNILMEHDSASGISYFVMRGFL